MGLALATETFDFSFMLIEWYDEMLSEEVLELFFSLWQVAHELERRGCLARVFAFEPPERNLIIFDENSEKTQIAVAEAMAELGWLDDATAENSAGATEHATS